MTIIDFFNNGNNIMIVSPFISSNFNFFPFDSINKPKNIVLITTLKPYSPEQIDKVKFFKQLSSYCKRHNVILKILIDNTLHGKIYISKKDNEYYKGLITSANFTQNGLVNNNEWGVEINDKILLEQIENNLLENIRFGELTDNDIINFENIINKTKSEKKKESLEILNLIDLLNLKSNPFNIPAKANYWLKPIGTNENPISWNEKFIEIETNLHFSNIYPRGVKIGDILITYAVKHKNILSIYRVISKINKTSNPNDRFPYYVVGENLTSYYGEKWNEYKITISNEKELALSKKLFNVTPSGKNSYGSLMQGSDKLKLTKEFAEYLISKISKIDTEISTLANNPYKNNE